MLNLLCEMKFLNDDNIIHPLYVYTITPLILFQILRKNDKCINITNANDITSNKYLKLSV